jgi:hypothetical protein
MTKWCDARDVYSGLVWPYPVVARAAGSLCRQSPSAPHCTLVVTTLGILDDVVADMQNEHSDSSIPLLRSWTQLSLITRGRRR